MSIGYTVLRFWVGAFQGPVTSDRQTIEEAAAVPGNGIALTDVRDVVESIRNDEGAKMPAPLARSSMPRVQVTLIDHFDVLGFELIS